MLAHGPGSGDEGDLTGQRHAVDSLALEAGGVEIAADERHVAVTASGKPCEFRDGSLGRDFEHPRIPEVDHVSVPAGIPSDPVGTGE